MSQTIAENRTEAEKATAATGIHTTSGRWRYGLFLTMIAALLWGILPTALKLLVSSMDAYTITWYRLVIAFAVLFVFLTIRGNLPDPRRIRGIYAILFAVTCLGLCVNYITYVLGVDIVGPGPSQLIIQLNSVIVILGGIFIYRERFYRLQAVGLAAIIIGLLLFFHDRLVELLTSFTGYSLGILILLLSATALATYSLAQKQLLARFNSLQISMTVFGAGALLLLPLTARNLPEIATLEWPNVALLLFCVFTTLGAYGSFAEALQHLEASKISAVLSTVPLIALGFAALASWLLPDLISTQPVSPLSLAGAVILVVGSYLVARRHK